MFTLPGSPCIYYGTEAALPGGHDPDCRCCMPWDQLGTSTNQERTRQLHRLIGLRRTVTDLRDGELDFVQAGAGDRLEVLLNADPRAWTLPRDEEVLFGRNLDGDILAPGGVCIRQAAASREKENFHAKC